MIDFRLDEDGAWRADVVLPSWRGHQSRLGPSRRRDKAAPSDGTVRLGGGEGGGPTPTRNELAGAAWLLAREAEASDAVRAAVLDAYPKLLADAAADGAEPAERIEVATVEDLKRVIGLHQVRLHDVATPRPIEAGGAPLLGFEIGCDVDPEHGIGVLCLGATVLEIGRADVSILRVSAEEALRRHG